MHRADTAVHRTFFCSYLLSTCLSTKMGLSKFWSHFISRVLSPTRPYQTLLFLTTTMGFYVETYLLGHIFPQMSHGCFQGYFSNHCIVLQHMGLQDEFVGIGVWTDIAECRGFNFFGRSYVIFFFLATCDFAGALTLDLLLILIVDSK